MVPENLLGELQLEFKRTQYPRQGFVCWLLAEHPSDMIVYLIDGSAHTVLRTATMRYKLQIQLSTSPSHSILSQGQPVPVLTLQGQTPGGVATGVPVFKSLVRLEPEKPRRKRDSAHEADALTTRPARRSPSGDKTCAVVLA